VATAPAFTADGTGGAYTVTATVNGVATVASFSLTNTAPDGQPVLSARRPSRPAPGPPVLSGARLSGLAAPTR
jgi:hypothetical protein